MMLLVILINILIMLLKTNYKDDDIEKYGDCSAKYGDDWDWDLMMILIMLG